MKNPLHRDTVLAEDLQLPHHCQEAVSVIAVQGSMQVRIAFSGMLTLGVVRLMLVSGVRIVLAQPFKLMSFLFDVFSFSLSICNCGCSCKLARLG